MTLDAVLWTWSPGRLDLTLETAARFFESHLEERHREHLHTRYGLTDETIRQARIGFAPADRDALVISLMNAGITAAEIKACGLVVVGEFGLHPLYRGRLIFPYLVGGRPAYFIGRKTDETDEWAPPDKVLGKYKKQMRSPPTVGITEPIFGADTVRTGEPLIITEGITDCISAHQAGYAAVSPVTVRFKKEHGPTLAELCRPARGLYLIMDSETSEAGLHGAIATGLVLSRAGLRPYLCEIPRPDGVEKVDLNEFIRDGGDVAALFKTAIDVEEHPIAEKMIHEERYRAGDRLRAAIIRDRAARSTKPKKGPTGPRLDKAEVLAAIPSLRSLIGFEGYGPHPRYGSSTGANLSVTGEMWYCFHKGSEGGGGPLEWIAVYEMGIIREDEKIPPERFPEVLEYAADLYLPGWRDRAGGSP